MNIYNSNTQINDSAHIYGAFNDFIFSSDRKVLHKLLYRYHLFKMVEHLPGDIVEAGIYRGSGLFTWAKLIELFCPFEIKRVVGFDFFGPDFLSSLPEQDREPMSQVFTRSNATESDLSDITIRDKLLSIGIPEHKFELVKGDVSETTLKYVQDNPGFRISLLYMDLDLEKPTYDALENLWDRILSGGIVVFDEYSYCVWSESNAVDRFIKKHNLTLYKTNVSAPTAYIVKP